MYAIIRTKKHKSFGAIARSSAHTFREVSTPNALSELNGKNIVKGADSSKSVLAKLKSILPLNRRRDAVLCIEYLITASPEAFCGHQGELNDLGLGYFDDSLKWLKARHGSKNIISAAVHLDEKTPHLVVYVAPITEDGRLSARDFLGGPRKMRDLQDDFYTNCAKKYGLLRGQKGSKAKHSDVANFYSAILSDLGLPSLKALDYIAKAMGIETDNWAAAQNIVRAQIVHSQTSILNRKRQLSEARSIVEARRNVETLLESVSEKNKIIDLKLADIVKRENRLNSAKALIERDIRSMKVLRGLPNGWRTNEFSPEKVFSPRQRIIHHPEN